MATINPYLSFSDNCEEVFEFYRSVFGGDFLTVMRFKDMPSPSMDESEAEKIMHVALPIGHGTTLMGSDTPAAVGSVITGNNFSISIGTDSQEEATRLFNKLSAGGQTTMPLDKAPWGAYFGMLTDKFGIQWMVSYDNNQ